MRPDRSISCTRPAGTEERNYTNSTWAMRSRRTSIVDIEISSDDLGELLSQPAEVEQYTRGVDLNALLIACQSSLAPPLIRILGQGLGVTVIFGATAGPCGVGV